MRTELKKDEEIIIETRPHWLTLVIPFLLTFISFFVGFRIGNRYGFFVAIFFIIYFIYKVIERKNNIWAVTNLRVVDESGVFSNSSKESPLEKINNVSFSQPLLGQLFDYGDVQIQTAAEIGSTTYYFVENPKELRDNITQMQEEYKHHQIKKQASELAKAIVDGSPQNNRSTLASEIEKLFSLKEKGIITEDEYNKGKDRILNA